MHAQRLIGLALLILGIVLLIMGIRATDSFASQVSEFFTGSPTDRAIWLTIGGVLAMLAGATTAMLPARAAGR